MEVKKYEINGVKFTELISENVLIQTAEDGLQLLGDLYYSGFDGIILHKENITPEFFDLKTGMAGEVLQKFSNYRMRLIIVGDISDYTSKSKSLSDFVFECNNGSLVNFKASID